MNISLDAEIRAFLERYLDGQVSLKDFVDWFVSASWNVHTTCNPEAIRLSGDIELRLAEHSGGRWSEHELRDHLAELLQPQTTFSILSPVACTASSNATITETVQPILETIYHRVLVST